LHSSCRLGSTRRGLPIESDVRTPLEVRNRVVAGDVDTAVAADESEAWIDGDDVDVVVVAMLTEEDT